MARQVVKDGGSEVCVVEEVSEEEIGYLKAKSYLVVFEFEVKTLLSSLFVSLC